jgi:hypothetical protein
MRILRLSLPAVVSMLVASEAVAADNPAVQACGGKAKGDACTFTKPQKDPGTPMGKQDVSGTCQDDECCELDYSKGSPPTSNCGPCLACKEGGGAAAADEGGPAASAGPNPEPTRAGDDPPAGTGNGKRGCSIGSGEIGWGWMVLSVIALGSRRRRA